MRAFGAVVVAIVVALVLVAQPATADPASREKAPVLTHKQVLHIALVKAAMSRDPHPKRIEMATVSLRAATKVTDPTGGLGTAVNGKVVVDLVVMHGYFHVDGSPPHGRSIAPGKVLELIIDAHTGFLSGLTLENNVPVPLSRLGHVTRLR